MIKFAFRWAFRLLLLAVVLVIGILLLKNTILLSLAEARIRQQTGFDVKIGRLDFSLAAPRVSIENLVLYNPAEFGGSPVLDIPDLHFEYDRSELALRRLQLRLLRVDLRELHIVESQQGRTNLVDLLGKVSPEAVGAPASGGSSGFEFAGTDLLNLSVGKVRYTNLRLPRRNQETPIGIRSEIIPNVRTEQDLLGILFKILLRAGIPIYLDHKPVVPVAKPV